MLHVLYFNGLGSGKIRRREQLALHYLAKHGITVTAAQIDWYAGEDFTDLLARMITLTEEQLKTHGKLVLVGSSAGGSMVVNILGQLHNPNLYGVTLCSRLHEAPLPWWDGRNLTRMAHIGTSQPSQAFFDSVTYCGEVTIPKLTKQAKGRLVIVQQWADFVVPRPTMSIDGVRVYRVPALGHGWGIATGVRRLPEIIKLLNTQEYDEGMVEKKFTIEHDTTWQRPDQAYFDYKDAAKGLDPEKLEWDGKYKTIREKRDIAVFGASIYTLSGEPTFVQMNTKSASPDAFLLQKSSTDETSANIAPVEITFYGGSKIGAPTESLADRLSKPGGKFQEKLPPGYWLLVHIGIGLEVDHQAVTDKLRGMDAQFGVFSVQEISNHPDTVMRFVTYNPDCKTIDVNLGETFDKLTKSNIPGTVTQVRGFPPKQEKDHTQ